MITLQQLDIFNHLGQYYMVFCPINCDKCNVCLEDINIVYHVPISLNDNYYSFCESCLDDYLRVLPRIFYYLRNREIRGKLNAYS
jgi:hypothetical protein